MQIGFWDGRKKKEILSTLKDSSFSSNLIPSFLFSFRFIDIQMNRFLSNIRPEFLWGNAFDCQINLETSAHLFNGFRSIRFKDCVAARSCKSRFSAKTLSLRADYRFLLWQCPTNRVLTVQCVSGGSWPISVALRVDWSVLFCQSKQQKTLKSFFRQVLSRWRNSHRPLFPCPPSAVNNKNKWLFAADFTSPTKAGAADLSVVSGRLLNTFR